MPGFYSYVLEQRITFDASPINLAGSTADWTPVQSSDSHDPKNDSQSSRGETDLVGDGTHTLLYAKYDTKDTATESDDEIGFRLRIGATDADGGFGSLGAVGVDANSDGIVDLFLAYDGRATPTVSIFEPGPGGNDTPASTSLQNAVVAAGAETDISLVDATTDPTATDTDLNDDGNTDAFVSFKFLFSSLKDQMSSVSGISLSKDSALQFATFTLTQENAIDGDIGGISGSNADTDSFTDLGIFSKAVTPSALGDTTPVITPTADPNITGGTGFKFIDENTTAVSTVTASDSDGDTISFSISGGADQDLFQIDSVSGDLSFKVAPDFENPESASGLNRYSILVEANDGQGGSDSKSVVVIVRDADDPAVISSDGGGDTATIDHLENTATVTTVVADDGDGDAVDFALAGGADESLFEIDATTGVLVFKAAPDFETPNDGDGNNEYVVAVQATSSGGTDTQTITVRVANANEAPVISSDGGADSAAVSVAEETTAVTTVVANDVDGNAVSFEIAGGDDAARFQIDGTSGALTFTAAPDFEIPGDADGDNDYVVIVQANDGLGETDTQTITVTVTNANDSPVITSDGGGDAAAVDIAENTTVATTVTADDANGDAVSFEIDGGADATLFDIDRDTGVLTFRTAPNFEAPADFGADNEYLVTVRATDAIGNTDTQAIAITVTDVNEAPVVTSNGGGDAAAVDIVENTTALTTVAATDNDGDAVNFSITGGADSTKFEIDSVTGVLSFKTAPDFENPDDADGDNTYVVTVQASDNAGGIATQTISARVINGNDAPIITSGGGAPAAISVVENSSTVTTVQAGDADGDAIGFSIAGGADAAFFQIDAATGALTFNAAPDFETPADADGDNSYVVTVQASDGAGGADTQTITVSVTKADETAATAPDIPPVLPVSGGGPSPDAGAGTGGETGTGESSGTNLVTGADSGAPAPLVFELSPAPVADAPDAPDTPAPAETPPPESATENLSEAAAEALAEAAAASLANLAPAAGSNDTETVREQFASVEAQTRDTQETQQSPSEQGPSLILDAGIPDTVFEADSSFTFRLPENVFAIVGVNASTGLLSELGMEATLADGSPLPEWLIFDPLLNEFRGTLPEGGDLTFEIRVTATDIEGNEASATFLMFIEPAEGETEKTEQGTGNQQSSAHQSGVLTAPTIEAENASKLGENPRSTGAIAPHTPSDGTAKLSLTDQIQDTGFGKFQAEALRLALGRSG